tara:strand:+ start:713 stop:1234 length:522 start_codon:yes stop_codon:yes gene_type:complete
MKTKWYKIVGWVLVPVLGLFFVFLVWYKYEYSMAPVAPYSLNAQKMATKLLIATQGSDFKSNLTQGVVDYYKSNSVSIDVIDVSTLSEIAPEDYDAILLIHTWEYGKPPESVQSFMDKNSDFKGKMVVMTTSGEGSEKMKNIDAISGESILKDSPVIVAKIIARLNPLLTTEK